MRTAVIGIGSNSVRMLLAEVTGEHGTRLARERAVTRLFAGLGEDGSLSPEAMKKTAIQAAVMAVHARQAGAEELMVFATSATRDAANREAFCDLLEHTVGVRPFVCSGEEEALHSYLGASDGGVCGVIDIGGGSTELVCGEGARRLASFSCQLGAVRLHQTLPDIASADLPRVVDRAEAVIRETRAGCVGWTAPRTWWGTGGTFTSLGALVNHCHWQDRRALHGTLLTPALVQDYGERLAAMTLEERMRLPGLQPGRADIVVHGICIVLACMRCMDIPELRVSEYGNLEGYLKWHYRLSDLDTAPSMDTQTSSRP